MDLFGFSINLSPIKSEEDTELDHNKPFVARKLFDNSAENLEETPSTPSPSSPPYKRVRQLRLSEEPLNRSSSNHSHERLMKIRQRRAEALLGDSKLSSSNSLLHNENAPMDEEAYSKLMLTYGNPYTAEVQALIKKRASCSAIDNDVTTIAPEKRIKEATISKLEEDFVPINERDSNINSVICMRKIDGCLYSVKRLPVVPAGSDDEKVALNEVHAHAALEHPHIVNYFASWSENDAILLQTEYCDGGSLRDVKAENGPLQENELLYILAHISAALDYIHSLHMVHLNVSPSSIYLCERKQNSSVEETTSDEEDDNEERHYDCSYNYKLGNLRHVTLSTSSDVILPEESIYMSNEIKQKDFSQLTAADIYSLGITVFEAGGGELDPGEMTPGNISLPNVSKQLNSLLQSMTSPDPSSRPSASTIRDHPILSTGGRMSKSELLRLIAAEEHRTQVLTKQLELASKCIKQLNTKTKTKEKPSRIPVLTRSNFKRSMSTEYPLRTTFRRSLSSDSNGSLSSESDGTLSAKSRKSALTVRRRSPRNCKSTKRNKSTQ